MLVQQELLLQRLNAVLAHTVCNKSYIRHISLDLQAATGFHPCLISYENQLADL